MEPRIVEQILPGESEVDVYIAFALLWIAAADGALDRNAHAYLYRHLDRLPRAMERADALLTLIAANDLPSFLRACRGLQRELSPEDKAHFLELAIGAATAGEKLSIAANHILRLFADLLNISAAELQSIYQSQTGGDLVEPADLSSPAWWDNENREDTAEEGGKFELPPGERVSRAEAYSILGLAREAPKVEIKRAYRRLVQSYHPDRYESLGPAAREEAEMKFIRVQQAYEVLSE